MPATVGSPVIGDRRRPTALRLLYVVLCAAVLAIGASFRCVGLDWDGTHHLHPDERFLCLVEDSLRPVGSVHEYFDTTRSTLNPNARGYDFYVYGDFPLILVQYLGSALAWPGIDVDVRLFGRALSADYNAAQWVGRGVSAACDLVTLLIVLLIGRRLCGPPAGLLAAGLYAGAVLPIQQAHFFTVDSCATMWATIALWLALRAVERARLVDEVAFGVALGLGLASKLSVLAVAPLLVVAVLLRVATTAPAPVSSTPGPPTRRVAAVRAALGLNVAAIVAMMIFRLGQPYAFLPPDIGALPSPGDGTAGRTMHVLQTIVMPRVNPAWVEQLAAARRMQAGLDDAPPNHQWAQRTPLLFPWLNLTRYGLGWPLGLTASGAWLWAIADVIRRRPGWTRQVLLVVWVGGCFLWVGTSWVKAMRYLLPIYPALTVLTASALVRAGAAMSSSVSRHIARTPLICALLAAAPAIAVLLPTYAWAFAFTRIYTRPVTRVAASEWIYAHAPAGAAIATEGTWDDPLPLPLAGRDPWVGLYQHYPLEMVWEDTPRKRARLQYVLEHADYIVISSNRFYGSLPRNPSRWPMTTAYYHALFDGRLGFRLVADFTSHPSLGPFHIDDQGAEEAFTVYDHPRVFVFEKTPGFDPAAVALVLGRVDLRAVGRLRADQVREPPPALPAP
jgi:hypothetical protein